MANNKDSIAYTVTVALLLCIVCSIVVSVASVSLKPAQEANKELDFKRNILAAAGLLEPGVKVEEQFKNVDTYIVNLENGKFSDEVSPEKYDQRKAAKDPSMAKDLSSDEDIAKIGMREKFAEVYKAPGANGGETLILPIRGYGLWSTLYGFIAIESDYNTVVGIGFYEHGETPGLGGEVDNPSWKALWDGKELFNDKGELAIQVIKGKVDASTPKAEHKVDGLSGATLTTRGVDNLIKFWLGENGYGPFIENLKKGEA